MMKTFSSRVISSLSALFNASRTVIRGESAGSALATAAGVAVFFFDRSVTAKLREQVEAELKNPYLKGDLLENGADDEADN